MHFLAEPKKLAFLGLFKYFRQKSLDTKIFVVKRNKNYKTTKRYIVYSI